MITSSGTLRWHGVTVGAGGTATGASASVWKGLASHRSWALESTDRIESAGHTHQNRQSNSTQARPPDQGLIFRLSNRSWQQQISLSNGEVANLLPNITKIHLFP